MVLKLETHVSVDQLMLHQIMRCGRMLLNTTYFVDPIDGKRKLLCHTINDRDTIVLTIDLD